MQPGMQRAGFTAVAYWVFCVGCRSHPKRACTNPSLNSVVGAGSHWCGLSMIAPTLAGTMRLTWLSFALLDGLGAAIWTGAAIGSGMLLHQQIGRLVALLQELEPFAIGAIAMSLAAYIAIKWWQRRRFYDRLRMARITVDELHQLVAEGQRPVIVDLRTSLVRDQDCRTIPGA